MSLDRARLLALALLVGLVFPAGSALAQNEPEILFDVKTDKKVKDIYLIGENEDYILLTNKARIFVHDSATGEKIWDTKVPNYTDDGSIIWQSKGKKRGGLRHHEQEGQDLNHREQEHRLLQDLTRQSSSIRPRADSPRAEGIRPRVRT